MVANLYGRHHVKFFPLRLLRNEPSAENVVSEVFTRTTLRETSPRSCASLNSEESETRILADHGLRARLRLSARRHVAAGEPILEFAHHRRRELGELHGAGVQECLWGSADRRIERVAQMAD